MILNVVLRAIADTTLKVMPVAENRLSAYQKKVLKEGEVLPISNHRTISGHLTFECFEDINYIGKWYVEADTVEISVKKNA